MAKLRFRDAKESDIPWLVDRHIALYSSEAGFNDEFGPVVSNALQHYFDTRDPERERAFVPVPNNGPVGSLFLTRSDAADCAQIRLFWLEPEWRGQGLAQRMLSCAHEFACSVGYRHMLVRTYDRHVAAGRIYARTGFDLVEEKRVQSFGQSMTEQAWLRAL